jgi:diaminohydroxyphosphoribosylaminopyrimidine deaminase/5-amino-6-(5-phosphoribosylamino)uracil reductase
LAFSSTDQAFMKNALALASKARGCTSPNPLVGAVIVNQGQIVGRGFHAKAGEPHAEALALREAGPHAEGATLYCTLEPCCHYGRTPPCTRALVEAGIRRVVAAMIDPNPKVRGQGAAELRAEGIDVEMGCLENDARYVNEFYVTYYELDRPFVTLKWAMTIDGRTGTDSNHSRWISNEASRRYVHQMRAEHDAILIGIGTVFADDPLLNVRLEHYTGRQPIRVVIDGALSIPRRARMLLERHAGPVILIATPYAPEAARRSLESDGHRVVVLPSRRRLIDLRQLMGFLHAERIQSVIAEGGRQIHTALLQQRLADKLLAFVSPKVIGGAELRAPVEGLGYSRMDEAIVLHRPIWKNFDEDICLEAYLRQI